MDVLFDCSGLNIAIAVIFLSTCLYLFFTSTFNYWKDRGVPYVKPLPLFGNVKDQIFKTKSQFEVFGEIYKNLQGHEYGGFFVTKIPRLMILNPELVEKILVKDFAYFYDRGFPADPERDPLSAHLFSLEGNTWRNLRYKLTPTFTTGKLKGMFEQICNCGDSVIKHIEEESKTNKSIEIAPLLASFSLDVIASCAFGLQIDKNDEMYTNFHKAVKQVFEPSGFTVLKHIVMMYSPRIAVILGLKAVPISVENLFMTIVKETIKFRENNNVNRNDFMQLMMNLRKQEEHEKVENPEEEHSPEDDIIDQMKHAVKKEDENLKDDNKVYMTDELIAAQTFVFLAGGSETVSLTIGYCLYCLAQNPHIQDKVQKEIDQVLQKSENNWSYKVLKDLTYLDQVVQETMRFYPVSPTLFRSCTQPYKLPGANIILEKGIQVVIPVQDIQRDPKNYDSPETFDPDRFADNNFKPSGIYLPFGDGPRICIAMRFAVLEVKVALARILSQYTIKLNEKTQLPIQYRASSFLLAPKNNLRFNFNKRAKI